MHYCQIAPPDLLARLADEGTRAQREAVLRTLAVSAAIRARRALIAELVRVPGFELGALIVPALREGENRSVYDAEHRGSRALPGRLVRREGDPPVADAVVNDAYDGVDKTYQLYDDVFERRSIDDRGLPLISSVHFGVDFDNAFWNGSEMIYGDGSGHVFAVGSLTRAIDVIGHELTHGVTQYTAGLAYHDQPGALNESISDVFGSLVKQYAHGQSADEADWLIGTGILGPALHGKALRSMKAPGTAFEGDNQPAHMKDYVYTTADNGGVHTNSGIPNHAFYLAATAIGGFAWEKAGRIWYETMLTRAVGPDAAFHAFAAATVRTAARIYGRDAFEKKAVDDAWRQVGVLQSSAVAV
jgi:Zn-dependent metalloprotease